MALNKEIYLLSEKVRAIYGNAVSSAIAITIIALLLWVGLVQNTPPFTISLWALWMILVALHRIFLKRAFDSAGQPQDAPIWARRFTINTLLAGIGWGVLSSLFFDSTGTTSQLAIVMIVLGVLALSVPILSWLLPAFVASTLPPSLVLLVVIYTLLEQMPLLVSAALLLYIVIIYITAIKVSRFLDHSLVQRFEKDRLVTELNREIEQRRKAQQQLEQQQQRLEKEVDERTRLLQNTNNELTIEIEQRKKAQHDLEENEWFLETIIENIPHMLFVKEAKELSFVRLNKAAEELLGLSKNQLLTKKDHDFFPAEEADFFTRKDREVLESGQIQNIPREEIETLSRGKRILHTKKIPILDQDGQAAFLLGISEDITDQVKADSALQTLVQTMVGLTGQEYFDKVTSELCRWLNVDGAHIGVIYKGIYIKAISMQLDGEMIPDFQYHLEATPCSLVLREGPKIYPDNALRLFPNDLDLQELHILGYAGVPIQNQQGESIGIVWVISRKPLQIPPQWEDNFTIIAAKAGAEIERMEAEKTLGVTIEKYRALVETTRDFVWEVNAKGVYTYASPQSLNMLGYPPEELIGITPFDIMEPEEAKTVSGKFNSYLKRNAPFSAMVNTCIHKDGHKVVLETSAMPFFNSNGQLAGYRGIDRDITERKQIEQKLEHLATYDRLTDLPNRQLLETEMVKRIQEAERFKQQLGILFIDLDNFKEINDSLGHSYGDLLLQQVSERIASNLRKYDTLARFGGDEFILLTPRIDSKSEIERIASKVLNDFATPFQLNHHCTRLTASIGIALYPRDGRTPSLLIRKADKAMYHAKESGKGCYRFFSDDNPSSSPLTS